MVRISGDLIPIKGMSNLGATKLDRMIGSLFDDSKAKEFDHNHHVDFPSESMVSAGFAPMPFVNVDGSSQSAYPKEVVTQIATQRSQLVNS